MRKKNKALQNTNSKGKWCEYAPVECGSKCCKGSTKNEK